MCYVEYQSNMVGNFYLLLETPKLIVFVFVFFLFMPNFI